METNHCSRCNTDKAQSDWHVSAWMRSGSWCKACMRAYYLTKNTNANTESDAPRPCQECGTEYQPKIRRRSIFCSRKCKHAAGNARARIVRFTGRSPRPCVHCGATIGPERRIDAKFCSAECNSRAHQLKRKLRTRGGGNTGFVRAEIAGRDGFTCGICAEPVDMVLAYPDPGFASLDHILPVSHGGSSEPENLRLTHLLCNVTRRNRPEVA